LPNLASKTAISAMLSFKENRACDNQK
jgi:hypothetical protein